VQNTPRFVGTCFLIGLAVSSHVRSDAAEARILKGHLTGVIAVAFSPDGATLASASTGDTIKLWDVKSGALLRTLYGNSGDVCAIAFSSDGKVVASGGQNGDVTLWELGTGRACAAPSAETDRVMGIAFAPHDAWLAAGGVDRTIRLWEPRSGKQTATLTGHARGVLCVAFSAEGKTLASGSADGAVKLWNTEGMREATSLPLGQRGRHGPVVSLDFAPDGKELAIATRDVVEIWDVVHSERRIELEKRPKGALWWGAHYSSRGTLVAIGTGARYERSLRVSEKKGVSTGSYRPEDRVVRVWDARTGREITRCTGHHDSVRAVALSPDGAVLATGSRDKTVRLWDLAGNRSAGERAPVIQAAAFDSAHESPASPAPNAGARVECLKELELLTPSTTTGESAGPGTGWGDPSDSPGAESPDGSNADAQPLLSDAVSLLLDNLLKEKTADADTSSHKAVNQDFTTPFRFDSLQDGAKAAEGSKPTQGASPTPAAAQPVDPVSRDIFKSTGGTGASSGWGVFDSPAAVRGLERVGRSSWDNGGAGSRDSHEFHYDGRHGGSGGGGEHGHGDEDRHKK
jgi:WD40 repeat protein